MQGVLQQILLHLRLNFRSRMAVLYQYLFPIIFLAAFRTVYRQERFPLAMHVGELLTITILGSAAFGLPSGIVSDRERGIWRRYKILPVSSFGILAGTLVTRYLLLLTAALLVLALAMATGMPMPAHPFAMWAAFTISAIAFMGVGLDLAMLATNVPAVQALGQCIFLPMLIVGGVAFPLSSLPAWAQHLSAFLPGRYSVQAIQACVTGTPAAAQFDVLALVAIGVTGAAAGLLAFRWDNRQRPSPWIALALLGWLIAGIAAESRGIVHVSAARQGAARGRESPPYSSAEGPYNAGTATPVSRR
jgi:ABC-2 type transport system permease protein